MKTLLCVIIFVVLRICTLSGISNVTTLMLDNFEDADASKNLLGLYTAIE